MKIVQLAHFALPHVGGLEFYVHRVARDLIAAGHQCEVISSASSTGDGVPAKGMIDQVPMTWLPSLRLLPRNPALLGLREHLARIRPDVVHVHSIWFLPGLQACLWKRRLGYRLVNSVHGVWPDDSGLLVRAFVHGFRPAAQHVLDCTDQVLVLNRLERERLRQHFRCDEARVSEAGMGFDPVEPAEALVQSVRERHGRFLLFTGRIIADKNPGLLVEAFSRVAREHAGLRLVFAGPIAPALRQQLTAANRAPADALEFLGALDPVAEKARLAALYAAAELSVCIGSWEGFPTRILESLAQGTPVAAFAAGSVAEVIVHGQNGYLLRSLSPEELEAAIRTQLALPAGARAALSARARASAQPYLWSESFARIHAALRRAVSGR